MSFTCAGCAKQIDPLRAGHVAIFGESFYYFCDRACRDLLNPGGDGPSAAAPSLSPHPAAEGGGESRAQRAQRSAGTDSGSTGDPNPPVRTPNSAEKRSEVAPALAKRSPSGAGWSRRIGLRRDDVSNDGSSVFTLIGLAGGVLGVALALAGATPLVAAFRVGSAALGLSSLLAGILQRRRDPTDVHPAALLGPGVMAIAIAAHACYRFYLTPEQAAEARALAGSEAAEATAFAGLVVAQIALAMHLIDRARQSLRREQARIAAALGKSARRAHGKDVLVNPLEVKTGDEILIEAGEIVSVDATIVAGDASVLPWFGAVEPVRRSAGDTLVAGARITAGKLRARATCSGHDRAWARLVLDPTRRADAFAKVARVGRRIAERGAVIGLLLGALAAFANGVSGVQIGLAAAAAFGAVASAAVGSIGAVHVAAGVLAGLRRGVSYRSAGDWDKAAAVSIAVFCARGTLLIGEPDLSDLEPIGRTDEKRLMALAAGGVAASTDSVARAVKRAAKARGVEPDAVRSPNLQVGLGISAVASTGDSLFVGRRALMLKEKISVAIAEEKIAEIEARGREAVLVALGGKLVGVLGLQDGLRPGARAAVQHLLDAHVEPVLLSDDSRETCEALGRALDIDHVRPEIPPGDQPIEVERLGHGGVVVAAVGRPLADEAVLAAADVGVALSAAGATPGQWEIALASDDVRDGALAITLAQRSRHHAKTGLTIAIAPGIAVALAVAFGLMPAAYAPIAIAIGAVGAVLHARATDVGVAIGVSGRGA
jgi:P-type Cu+ transporter